MDSHVYIFGTLADAITGETLTDTHDERFRQKIARLLLDEKDFEKGDLLPRTVIRLENLGRCADVTVDLAAKIGERLLMILRYGPGSLVTRERPALAASRLVAPYQVPVVVVTNGIEAEILDGATGKITGTGLSAIPTKEDLLLLSENFVPAPVSEKRAEAERRILFTYEAVGACNCDDGGCEI